jgi:hypothetical protein
MFGLRGTSQAAGTASSFDLGGIPMGVPQPSGGLGNASVHNKSLDIVQNDVPSVLVLPSSHSEISLDSRENDLRLNDFAFCLQNNTGYGKSYLGPFHRLGANEIPLVSLPRLNQIIRKAAEDDIARMETAAHDNILHNWSEANRRERLGAVLGTDEQLGGGVQGSDLPKLMWWASPELVANYAKPYGAVLNLMQLNNWSGGGDMSGKGNKNRRAVNCVVSRRANVKNNFFSAARGVTEHCQWHAQSMQQVCVQYSTELAQFTTGGRERSYPVVLVSMVLIDDPHVAMSLSPLHPYGADQEAKDEHKSRKRFERDPHRGKADPTDAKEDKDIALTILEDRKGTLYADEKSVDAFQAAPLRAGNEHVRVMVPIGRILNSPPRAPSAYEALNSCLSKGVYDTMKPVEIELGCP